MSDLSVCRKGAAITPRACVLLPFRPCLGVETSKRCESRAAFRQPSQSRVPPKAGVFAGAKAALAASQAGSMLGGGPRGSSRASAGKAPLRSEAQCRP